MQDWVSLYVIVGNTNYRYCWSFFFSNRQACNFPCMDTSSHPALYCLCMVILYVIK